MSVKTLQPGVFGGFQHHAQSRARKNFSHRFTGFGGLLTVSRLVAGLLIGSSATAMELPAGSGFLGLSSDGWYWLTRMRQRSFSERSCSR